MSHKAQGRRSQNDDDSDVEQQLHDKKHRNNAGGSNGYPKGKPSSNRKGSDDDSDSDEPQSKSRPSQKSEKKYESKSRRQDDSGSGEEEKTSGKSGSYEVIIKGLPFASSDQDINDFFQDCGEIDHINLLRGPDGRSKGIAFVKFFDEKGLRKAIELSGSELGGRTVQVEKTVPKEQRSSGGDRGGDRDRQRSERDPNSTTVFIGNLSYNTDAESIREIFESCGKIKDVRIATDQDGKPRGFAYVEFGSGESVDVAIQKTGTKLDGRNIRVDFTNTRKNDGGGGGGGGSRGFGGGRSGGSRGGGGYGGGGNRRGGNRY
jgi:nucleolin